MVRQIHQTPSGKLKYEARILAHKPNPNLWNWFIPPQNLSLIWALQTDLVREKVLPTHHRSTLWFQHQPSTKVASGRYWCSWNNSGSLSTVNERSEKEASKNEKPPIKGFLERNGLATKATWPQAHLLHTSSNEYNPTRPYRGATLDPIIEDVPPDSTHNWG